MSKSVCARCGRRGKRETMVFSRFTRNHYCADLDACARREKRNRRTRER